MIMNEPNPLIKVQILGKEYPIACPEEEQHDLLVAARYLDEKMRQIRNTGRVIGSERIAVMAALNIAHELLQARQESHKGVQEEPRDRSLGLRSRTDALDDD
ncbi:cell division protein ZapA [Candidatus Methylocalor cossyra]|uniref:Cell division protein ZapA n=1 Tax=Candidatus Methylocalor cossyra TaxID=3108543 RepID=A0ABM9NEN3_9GAMM